MVFLLCPECSNDLGSYKLWFDTVKKDMVNNYMNKNFKDKDYVLMIGKKFDLTFGDVLESVGITLECCKSHMLTNFEEAPIEEHKSN